MSEDRIESQIFYLDVISHSFIPLQLAGNQIFPVLAIWVNDYPQHSYAIPIPEDENQIPMYYISDVQRLDTATAAVEVTGRVAHDDFDNFHFEGVEEGMDEELEALLGTEIVYSLPAQVLEIVHALSTAEEGFHIFVFEGEPPMGAAHTPLRNILGAKAIFAFPPPDQPRTREHISEAFTPFATPSYQESWYPISYDMMKKVERGEDTVHTHVRQAQAILFELAGRLAHGEEIYLSKLIALARWLEQIHVYQTSQEGGDEDALLEQGLHFFRGSVHRTFEFADSFVHILRRTYARTFPAEILEPEFKALNIENVKEKDFQLEAAFAEIVSGLDFDGATVLDTFNHETSNLYTFDDNISDECKLMADPFQNGFPEAMKSLEEAFLPGGRLHDMSDLLRWNWVSPDSVAKGIKEHSLSAVMIAQVLIIAARAVVHADYINQAGKTNVSVTFNLVEWISKDDDRTMWELPAITPGITQYDVSSLQELMSMTPDTRNDKARPYLFLVLHQVMHVLFEEGWNLGNLDANLASLDISPPFLLKVRNLLAEMLEKLDETFREEGIDPEDIRSEYDPDEDDDDDEDEDEDEDDSCPFSMAYMKVLQNTNDVSQFISVASKIIPVMADVSAIRNSITPMDENWEKYRTEYVKNFFNDISATTARKI